MDFNSISELDEYIKINHLQRKYILTFMKKELFEKCCMELNLRYKCTKLKEFIDINWNNWIFSAICAEGYTETVKWIVSLGHDIHELSEMAFRTSCEYGQLETAKLLYSLGKVNIHAYFEDAFVKSCTYGFIEIAKWLYELGANIHEEHDKAFRWSCTNGNYEIAKWLVSLGGVNVNSFKHYSNPCLFGNLDIAKMLFGLNIDVSFSNYGELSICFKLDILNWILFIQKKIIIPIKITRNLPQLYQLLKKRKYERKQILISGYIYGGGTEKQLLSKVSYACFCNCFELVYVI